MKIHAGKYKNHKINRVNVKTTRETSSMVREAVFNMLGPIEGNVLDLFAGSGSYGLTSLSLGASLVVLNDNNKRAFKTLRENIEKLNINSDILIFNTDYLTFLKKNKLNFDYIFLDPPYDFDKYDSLLEKCYSLLNIGGKIVLETSKNRIIKIKPDTFALIKEKKYGIKSIKVYIK